MPEKNAGRKKTRRTDEAKVDESIDESFPASDPPAHGGVTSGAPEKRKTPDEAVKKQGSATTGNR